MKYILFATLLTTAAMATAGETLYAVTCGTDVIGEAHYVDENLVVTVEEGAACKGTLAIDGLDVDVEFDGDTVVVVAPETGETTDDAGEPDTEGEATSDEAKGDDATSDEDDEVAEDPEGDEKGETEAPLESALTGLDRADEVAGEHGRHGRDIARAAQGLDGDEAEGEEPEEPVEDEDDEKDDETTGDDDLEIDVELGVGLN